MFVFSKGVTLTQSFKTPFDRIYKKYVNILVSKDNGVFILEDDVVICVSGGVAVVEFPKSVLECAYGSIKFSYNDSSRLEMFSSNLMYRVL